MLIKKHLKTILIVLVFSTIGFSLFLSVEQFLGRDIKDIKDDKDIKIVDNCDFIDGNHLFVINALEESWLDFGKKISEKTSFASEKESWNLPENYQFIGNDRFLISFEDNGSSKMALVEYFCSGNSIKEFSLLKESPNNQEGFSNDDWLAFIKLYGENKDTVKNYYFDQNWVETSNNYFLEKEEDPNPYIEGIVFDVKDGRILIVEEVNREDDFGFSGNAIWLRIDNVFNLEDLKKGETVKAWVTGPVLESYPAQGTASKILITEEKDCYVGGCSGELCTVNPEAISTCEWLAGMECIKEGMICQLVSGNCSWMMSEEAASCFLEIIEKYGEEVKNSRIGYLFEKAEQFEKK